jgi:RNA polymerase sigma factor (TIGR02999 family)
MAAISEPEGLSYRSRLVLLSFPSAMGGDAGDITVLLRKWKQGDVQACDELMPHVYPHLHQVAAAYLRRESEDHTLQPTALVHELYIRLLQQRRTDWEDRAHFYAFAAKVMRRILTDHARRVNADKRGAGLPHVPLNDEIPWVNLNSDVIDLNRALDELDAVDPRKVRLVELRYFLGCTTPESAALMSISTATAERDLTFARTWLYSRLAAPRASALPPAAPA